MSYCRREKPPVASLISECLSAGTGCGWCVPFLKHLHKQTLAGDPNPDISGSPSDYAKRRATFRKTGQRDTASASDSNTDTATDTDTSV